MSMRGVLILGVLALAAACAPAPSMGEQQTASVRGCIAVATDHWRPDNSVDFAVEAQSFGPDCERALATIVVRDAQGRVQWTESAPTAHVMVLARARDAESMRRALNEWITTSNHTISTSSAFPEWPRGAAAPQNGEFPFYPTEQFDRENYEALRRTNTPVFCYVQGMESQACLALMNGELVKVGVQSFPG